MSHKQENIKLLLLEVKRLRQLIKIRDAENTLRELYEIEEETKTKLEKVKSLEEKALNEVVDQLDILEEIDIEISREKHGSIQSPIETLIEIKPVPIQGIQNRIERF
ncbi:hypothetical protein R9X47_26915 [Wukongibacter baidiensis]|uniref:hypothetical protein n=1 Tax=Wukongibacter baidiensis TaxID=1723361 RepID=UPI003D7F2125